MARDPRLPALTLLDELADELDAEQPEIAERIRKAAAAIDRKIRVAEHMRRERDLVRKRNP